jgi:hypothetical protein
MQRNIYYTLCRIIWKTKRSSGTRDVWVIGGETTIEELQKHKVQWIKDHFFKNTRVKPEVLITKIHSQKKIGVTSRPEVL